MSFFIWKDFGNVLKYRRISIVCLTLTKFKVYMATFSGETLQMTLDHLLLGIDSVHTINIILISFTKIKYEWIETNSSFDNCFKHPVLGQVRIFFWNTMIMLLSDDRQSKISIEQMFSYIRREKNPGWEWSRQLW